MNRIDELRDQVDAAEEALSALRAELEEARHQKAIEDLKNIEHVIPKYEKRLKRLKVYIDTFVENERGEVKYAFKKREHPYLDDFHEVMHDPLNWKISEYDLLDMAKYMEIIFEYHTDGVKDFVRKWMTENVEPACDEDSPEGFFGFQK